LQWMKYNMEAKFLNGKWKIDKMDGFASEWNFKIDEID
jgi:hypothetical protein